MKLFLKTLFLISFSFSLLELKADNESINDLIVGSVAVCTEGSNTHSYFVDNLGYSDNCELYYSWSVTGGTIPDGSTSKTAVGLGLDRISVDWETGASSYRVSVSINDQFASDAGNCNGGNFSASDLFYVTEDNSLCGNDGGGDDGGNTDPEEPEISSFTVTNTQTNASYTKSRFEPLPTLCPDEFNLTFESNALGATRNISIIEPISGDTTELDYANDVRNDDVGVTIDLNNYVDGTTESVSFICEVNDVSGDAVVSAVYTIDLLPRVDVGFTELMPPIHEGSGDAQVILTNTNDEISNLKINAFLTGPCDEEDKSNVEVYIGKDSIETVDVCTSMDSDFGIGVKYLEKENDEVVLVDDSIGISNGIYLIQIEAAQAVADSFEVNADFCPQFYYFQVPDPTTINTFSISRNTVNCHDQNIQITGTATYNKDYTNNPAIIYELYNGEDLVNSVELDAGGQFTFNISRESNGDSGNYHVKAIKSGCEGMDAYTRYSTDTLSINFPEPISYEILDVTDESCYNENDGSIFFEITGGTGKYSIDSITADYQDNFADISDINDTIRISDLSPGDHHIEFTIIDEKDCELEVEVDQNIAGIELAIGKASHQIVNYPSCLEGFDGKLEIVPEGGNSGDYTLSDVVVTHSDSAYSGFDIIPGDTVFIDNIPANCDISFYIADSRGCLSTSNYNVIVGANTTALNFQNFDEGVDPQCTDSTGSVSLDLVNFDESLTSIKKIFKKIDGSDNDEEIDRTEDSSRNVYFSGLEPNATYYLEISQNGCTISTDLLEFTITNPDLPQLDSLTLSFSNGDVETYQNKKYLICYNSSATATVDIVNAGPENSNFTVKKEGDTIASSLVSVSSNQLVIDDVNAFNADSSTYEIIATDEYNCPFMPFQFTIHQASARLNFDNSRADTLFSLNDTAYHVSHSEATDGKFIVDVTGGINDGNGFGYDVTLRENGFDSARTLQSNAEIFFFEHLKANVEYKVEIVDALGCTSDTTFSLRAPAPIEIDEIDISSYDDDFDIACKGGNVEIEVSTTGGIYPHDVQLINNDGDTTSLRLTPPDQFVTFSGVAAETYQIRVTDKVDRDNYQHTIDSSGIEITEPSEEVAFEATIKKPVCFGEDGSLKVTPSGGVSFDQSDYEIRIRESDEHGPIQVDTTINELIWDDAPGYYYVEVEDANGCIASGNYQIPNIPAIELDNFSTEHPICVGDNTGTITVNATGGRGYFEENQGYKFTLQTIEGQLIEEVDQFQINSSYTFQNLYADDYEVIIYDSAECSITDPITLSERPDSLRINSLNYDSATCATTIDAVVKVRSTGGDGDHQLSIDNGNNWISSHEVDTALSNDYYYEFERLEGGFTYEILVKDTNECINSDSIFIPRTDTVSVGIAKEFVTCTGGNDGKITLSPSYGPDSRLSDFSYQWFKGEAEMEGENDYLIDSLSAGTYKVHIVYNGIQCSNKTYYIDIRQANEPLRLTDLQVSDFNCGQDSVIFIQPKIQGGWGSNDFRFQLDQQNWENIASEGNGDFYIAKSLKAGSHVLRIQDSLGCIVSDSFEVQFSQPEFSVIESKDVSCHNGSDGEIFVKGEYANMDYTLIGGDFSLKRSGQDSVIFTGLSAGNYQIVANKDSCISETILVTINNPEPLSANPVVVQKGSCGKSNGKLSVQIDGGVQPYDTVWRNRNDIIVDPDSLTSGYYKLRVTDQNNCSIEQENVFLPEVSDIEIDILDVVHTTCGEDNAQINLEVKDAVEPFKIYWNNIQYNQTDGLARNSLAAGNHQINVVDALGCEQDTSIQILESNSLIVTLDSTSYTDCNIDSGYVRLSIQNTTGGYEIEWPEGIEAVDQNSAKGFYGGIFYTAKVIDSIGCSASIRFKVPTTSDLAIESNVTSPTCERANGSIEIEVSGGSGPYEYNWSVDSLTGPNVSGLVAGKYELEVTDVVGCTESVEILLEDDTSIFPNYERIISNPSCLNDDGTIEIEIKDTTHNFVISWKDTQLVSPIREGLSAGNYTAIMSNTAGCYKEIPIELSFTAPPALNNPVVTNPLCGNENGKIEISSSEDLQNYHWSHDRNLNLPIAEDLASGDYWVYGVDSIGCTTDTLHITLQDVFTNLQARVLSDISASCLTAADGTISVQGFNGNPPYQYQWNDANQQTTSIATGLLPGDYSVTITDSSGCSQGLDISLGSRDPVEILSFESIKPSCTDTKDGQISVNLRGGNGNYRYEWSNGKTGNPLTGVGAGTYSLTVYDGEFCSTTGGFTLEDPNPIVVDQKVQSPVCRGESSGYAQLNISGGSGNYSVLWPDANNSFVRSDLTKGTYQVLVTDENGCQITIDVVIPEKPEITYDYDVISPQCPGDQNAAISLNSIEHVANPLIIWSNGKVGTDINNIGAGDHAFSIIDNDNCTFTDTITVYDPEPLQLQNIDISNPTCQGRRNGSISYEVTGGTGNYQFRWDDGSRNQNRFNLGDGSYELTITDPSNCSLIRVFDIEEPDAIQINTANISNVSCFNHTDGSIELDIIGGTGAYDYTWLDGHQGKNRSELSAGIYSVVITDENDCSKSFDFSIDQPNPIAISTEKTEPSCNGSSDGKIVVSVSGGSSPYQINWATGDTGKVLDNIHAGNYNLEITDSLGCIYSQQIILDQPNELRVTNLEVTDPICYQEASGYAKISTTGGRGEIEVEWEDGMITNERSDLMAGVHQVTLRDEENCTNQFQFTLEDPEHFTIDGIPSEVFLCGGGSIILDAGNWDTYNWTSANGFSSDQREADISAEGIYTLEVSTENGCTDEVSFEVIKDEDLLTADFLLTSEAIVGDTVVIVDISWPMPDSIRWDNREDPDIYVVSQEDYYQEVIFSDTGTFEMGMHAHTSFCQDYVRKEIEVMAREDASNSQSQRASSSIDIELNLNIYPNPNFGQFKLDIKANHLTDVDVKILDFNKGNILKRFRGKSSNRFVFEIRDENLNPGVYLVLVESGEVVRTEKFIIK